MSAVPGYAKRRVRAVKFRIWRNRRVGSARLCLRPAGFGGQGAAWPWLPLYSRRLAARFYVNARRPDPSAEEPAMPFVRVDLIKGKSAEYRKTLGEIIYKAMRETINVPENDKFQVITEHGADELNVADSYL